MNQKEFMGCDSGTLAVPESGATRKDGMQKDSHALEATHGRLQPIFPIADKNCKLTSGCWMPAAIKSFGNCEQPTDPRYAFFKHAAPNRETCQKLYWFSGNVLSEGWV
jgi:hypothetical protein